MRRRGCYTDAKATQYVYLKSVVAAMQARSTNTTHSRTILDKNIGLGILFPPFVPPNVVLQVLNILKESRHHCSNTETGRCGEGVSLGRPVAARSGSLVYSSNNKDNTNQHLKIHNHTKFNTKELLCRTITIRDNRPY